MTIWIRNLELGRGVEGLLHTVFQGPRPTASLSSSESSFQGSQVVFISIPAHRKREWTSKNVPAGAVYWADLEATHIASHVLVERSWSHGHISLQEEPVNVLLRGMWLLHYCEEKGNGLGCTDSTLFHRRPLTVPVVLFGIQINFYAVKHKIHIKRYKKKFKSVINHLLMRIYQAVSFS